MSASHFTSWTCPASSGATAARTASNRARTLPLAAGATLPRSVVIIVSAAPSRKARGHHAVRPFPCAASASPCGRRSSSSPPPGGEQGLAREVDAAQLGRHAITAPAASPSSGRAASSGIALRKTSAAHGLARYCVRITLTLDGQPPKSFRAPRSGRPPPGPGMLALYRSHPTFNKGSCH
ncbi:hypothetical protein [Streptomyces sp. NPDC003036]|uniref:hypothetical protein n=1 Tax=Streptomyces sp. NPDC003036 TaxID=3154442 RepID=UPI0033A5B74F